MSYRGDSFIALILTVVLLLLAFTYEPADSIILDVGISLADADGSFIGEDAGDALGTSVAFAGDVNGDGYDDILISAYVDDDAASDAGQVYLVFGNSSSGVKDMDIGNANASFLGELSSSYAGYSISGAGDVNGDGFDDILISSIKGNGEIYLIFGKSSGWAMDTSLSNSNASFLGESQGTGGSISGAGDVNGDGYDDFLIGGPNSAESHGNAGQTYLILGRAGNWAMDTSLSSVNASFLGEEGTDRSGKSVSEAGDVNGDGFDDFIIGAPNNDQTGGEGGKIYIIYGRSSGWAMDSDLSQANASFVGPAWSYQGKHVDAAGDVNGDGYDDLIISSESDQNGRVFVVFGGPDLGTNVSLYDTNASFVAAGSYDDLGYSISGNCDLNGDGFDDIMISAPANDDGGRDRGRTYIVYGKASGWSMNRSISNADVTMDGEVDFDASGRSIAMGGDVDGDGRPDILISSTANDEGGTNAGQVYLILNEPNTPPTISTTDDTDANEDEQYSVHYQATDAQTPTGKLEWSGSTNAGWLTFSPSTRYLNGTPGNDDVGSYWVNISVKDEHDGTTWTNFTLTVINVNDPPEILTTDVQTTDEDDLYSVKYDGIDIDPTNDIFTWAVDTDADWLSMDNASRYLNGTPDNYDVGSYWVNVTLSDNQGGYDWSNFTLTVNNVNDAPEILTSNVLYAEEDSLYSVRYEGFDMDPTEDTLTWDFISNAGWLSFDRDTGYLNGTPRNADVGGMYTVNITLSDGNGGSDRAEFMVMTNNTNDDPYIDHGNKNSTLEDELYSVHYSATDIDPTMDELTWTLRTDADWLSFDHDTSDLYGTPTNDDVGFYWVNIAVEDGKGGMDRTNFTLEVENVNDDPVIQTTGLPSIDEDLLYTSHFKALDIDPTNDVLTWSVSSDAGWLSIDPVTGYLNGTATNEEVGTYWVNVTVEDGNGGMDWSNFTVEVFNSNDPPVIDTVPITSAYEDMSYGLVFEGHDIDITADILTWSLMTNAEWLSMDPSTGELNGTPTNDDVGSFWVNVTVDDGKLGEDWLNFTIEVLNVNDPPSIITPDFMSTVEDKLYSILYVGLDNDPTNDTLLWSLDTDAEWLSIDPIEGYLNGTPGNSEVGMYWVNVTVEDGNGGVDWTNFTLEVVNFNDAPSILTIDVSNAIEDELYSVIYGAVDIDPTKDILTWSLDTDATWLSFDPADNVLSGTPTNDDVGSYFVNMSVSDGNGGLAWTYFTLIVENVNDAPVWHQEIPDLHEPDLEPFSIQLSVDDVDASTTIEFSVTSQPVSGLYIDPSTGVLKWDEPEPGTYIVNVSATDGIDTIYQTFTLTFPEEEKDVESFPWLPIIIIIVVVILVLLVLLFFLLRRKKEEPEEIPIIEE